MNIIAPPDPAPRPQRDAARAVADARQVYLGLAQLGEQSLLQLERDINEFGLSAILAEFGDPTGAEVAQLWQELRTLIVRVIPNTTVPESLTG